MAFDLVAAGGYGSGELGDVTDPVGEINTTAIADNFIPIDDNALQLVPVDKSVGIYGDFAEDMEVLISVGGTSEFGYGTARADELGLWCIASISAVDSVSRDDAIMINPVEFDNEAFVKILSVIREHVTELRITVTSIPHFRNLTLNSGCTLSPRANFPLVFKCSGTLTFNGGHIDLRNKGIYRADEMRVNTAQETDGTKDTDLYSGWENSQTKDRFIMNYGDGAAFIIANKLNVANTASRIGNPNFTGIQFCRGAMDSSSTPTNATNIGGSTILLVAGTITDFNPAIIAKYRDSTATTGVGLARCYIASNTTLRNDEGLYAYDCISNPARLETMNVKSFGNGSDGASSLTSQINNYAKVTAIDSTRKILTVTGKTTAGAKPFAIGSLVMFHMNYATNKRPAYAGRFFLAKIEGINGDDITLDTPLPADFVTNFEYYDCQLITIPQYSSYTLSGANTGTPAFADGKGGIFAIAVSGTCDIRSGIINVIRKGGGKPYGTVGLTTIGNAQNNNRLPIGQGHGSVFILAKNLVMNSATRIGATYSGAKSVHGTSSYFGGAGGTGRTGGGYSGEGLAVATTISGGWGGGGGWPGGGDGYEGGYGSNGGNLSNANTRVGAQGAHIMIIADTITGFNQTAISTGGGGGDNVASGGSVNNRPGDNASAGYGGGGHYDHASGGGYNGGGTNQSSSEWVLYPGGSSGWAFIYCNKADDQDTNYTVYF